MIPFDRKENESVRVSILGGTRDSPPDLALARQALHCRHTPSPFSLGLLFQMSSHANCPTGLKPQSSCLCLLSSSAQKNIFQPLIF
jgi:hypothetical protein